ncbi:MAG TPA: ammonia-forming cytochrome c nitrite reductase subunit c552, partial [Calditrichia bacterium]|nr:ammonia-forming cytochrome c nitrite reductase subunit c552 [Calditrichia bacterium]
QLGFSGEVAYPDISTKAKAQAFIGLDMDKLNDEKETFLKDLVPVWKKEAAEREAQMPIRPVSSRE